MEHSKLNWEDVTKFEEVKGYEQHIWCHQGKYYFVVDEGGIAEQRTIYELPIELFESLESGEKSLGEVSFKLQNNRWPPTEEEKKITRKKFIKQYPTSLIDVPQNRTLFTSVELEELIPIAEKIWIESEGKLPDDYVSPLKEI